MSTRQIEIYIDGASKGNPGPSGIGVVMCRQGQTFKNLSRYIGTATNNVAEYTALIYALKEALSDKAEAVRINTDSQLLYRQLTKVYRVKSGNIIELYRQAVALIAGFKKVELVNIPREDNRGADRLATLAIKQAGSGCSHRFASQSQAVGEESPGSGRAL